MTDSLESMMHYVPGVGVWLLSKDKGYGVRMYHHVCVGGVYVLFQVELELLGVGSNAKE